MCVVRCVLCEMLCVMCDICLAVFFSVYNLYPYVSKSSSNGYSSKLESIYFNEQEGTRGEGEYE